MIISEKPDKITSPLDVALIMQTIIAAEHETDQEREHFWAIGLNADNHIKYIELVSLGCLDRAWITPRETFRLAMLRACKSMIVCHNHPSGNITPSIEDGLFTKQIAEAGQILGIKVLDHIIIGNGMQKCKYYSFEDEGRMNNPANLQKQIPEKPVKTNKAKKPKTANNVKNSSQADNIPSSIRQIDTPTKTIVERCDELQEKIDNIKMVLDKAKESLERDGLKPDNAALC